MAKDPNKVYLPDGSEARFQTKEETKAQYVKGRDALRARRAEGRKFEAEQKAKPLEQKMRETGRSEEFIQAHKNDTPAMQKAFNKAQKQGTQPGHAITNRDNHTRTVK